MPKISIIIPIYKVESYIHKCIDSVLAQTFTDFEAILIDDGSPDDCGEICDEYAKKDDRIRVIHKVNGGLVNAWIAGVLASKAPYIGFVDGDDWIEPNMYETLYQSITEERADITTCCLCKNFPEKEIQVGQKETEIYEGDKVREYLVPDLLTNWSRENPRILNSRCDKLFVRELITDNLRFCNTEISTGEDLNIIFSALLDAKKVVCIGDAYLYHYRQGISSMISNYNPSLLQNNINLIRTMQHIANIKGYDCKGFDLFTAYEYYQVILSECLSNLNLHKKIQSIKQVMNNIPPSCQFDNLLEEYLAGGYCSKARRLSLFLLSYRMWWVCVIGAHITKTIKHGLVILRKRNNPI